MGTGLLSIVRCCIVGQWLSLFFAYGLDNGLAQTPPMGWMSGERFGCLIDCLDYPDDCISERLIKSTVDVLSLPYFQAAGYKYVVIDDCWMDGNRDSKKRLQADLKRFPNGMANLISYVHSRNLKMGLYIDLGNTTCGGFPGSAEHFDLDAQTLAEWKVDMVKVGACRVPDYETCESAYPAFGQSLNATGRPILYLCKWPTDHTSKGGGQINYSEIQKTCNQYRIFSDIEDSWESVTSILSFYVSLSYQFTNFSGPGAYSDPDQLLTGDFGLSLDQQRFQFALWSILSAPLFISADLRTMAAESRQILINQNAIAINQDPLGLLGIQILVIGQVLIWRKPILPKGSFAVAIFYTEISGGPTKVSETLVSLGLTSAPVYNVTESFSGLNYGLHKPWHTLDCEVNPNGALLFQFIAIYNFI